EDPRSEAESKTKTETVEESPRLYRPPVLRPKRPRDTQRGDGQTNNDVPGQSRTLEVRLQVLFDRHGFLTLNLLAAKPANSTGEFYGKIGIRDVQFAAIGDEWLQVAQPGDLGRLLGDELRIHCTLSRGETCSCSLSQRRVY